jgi:hypothetical protein
MWCVCRDLIEGTDKIIDISTKCHSILRNILTIQVLAGAAAAAQCSSMAAGGTQMLLLCSAWRVAAPQQRCQNLQLPTSAAASKPASKRQAAAQPLTSDAGQQHTYRRMLAF